LLNHAKHSRGSRETTISDIVEYRLEISFRQFLDDAEQLKFEVYYYKNGVASCNGEKIDVNVISKVLRVGNQQKKIIPTLQLDFGIDPSVMENNIASQLLFVCWLDIRDSDSYPFSINKNRRYIGGKFTTTENVTVGKKGLLSKEIYKKSDFVQSIKIATKDDLKSNKAWHKAN